jgi:hypothetical protein
MNCPSINDHERHSVFSALYSKVKNGSLRMWYFFGHVANEVSS